MSPTTLPAVYVLAGGQTFANIMQQELTASAYISNASWRCKQARSVVGGRSVGFAADEGPPPLKCTSCLDSMAHAVAPEYTNGFTCDECKVHHRRNPAHWYCRGPTCDVDICTGCAEKLRIEFAMLTTTPAPLRSGNGALRDLSDEFDAVGDECRGEDIDDAEIDNEDEVQHDSMHAVVSDVETSEAAARREYLAILCGRPKISRGERADILAGLLVARLRRHVLRRIPSNNGARDHEVLKCAARNLPAMAALLTVRNLVLDDIKVAKSNECVFSGEVFRFDQITAENTHMEGAYLYRHCHVWVRSGKVSGSVVNFKTRHRQHAAASLKGESRFYRTFPSAKIKETENYSIRRGVFEKLGHYVGFGFDRQQQAAVAAICDVSRSGLFVWPKATLDCIKRANETRANSQLKCISYLWELVFDLCLGPANVSESPGFESYLRIFGGAE